MAFIGTVSDLATDELELEFPQDNAWELLSALFGELFDHDWCQENAYGLNDLEAATVQLGLFPQGRHVQAAVFFLR